MNELPLLLAVLTGCFPEAVPLEGVDTWHELDEDGRLDALAVTLDMAVVRDIEEQSAATPDFSAEVREISGFDHARIDFNVHGHPPGVWKTPHWDLHFYAMSQGAREDIECKGQSGIDEARIPVGYEVDAKPVPFGHCVPGMGAHAMNEDATVLEPDDSGVARYAMIYGYDQGELVFLEPMVSQAVLEREEAFSLEILAPDEMPERLAPYPTRFDAWVDQDTDRWQFVLSDFIHD